MHLRPFLQEFRLARAEDKRPPPTQQPQAQVSSSSSSPSTASSFTSAAAIEEEPEEPEEQEQEDDYDSDRTLTDNESIVTKRELEESMWKRQMALRFESIVRDVVSAFLLLFLCWFI